MLPVLVIGSRFVGTISLMAASMGYSIRSCTILMRPRIIVSFVAIIIFCRMIHNRAVIPIDMSAIGACIPMYICRVGITSGKGRPSRYPLTSNQTKKNKQNE